MSAFQPDPDNRPGENRFISRWYPEVRSQGFTNVDGTIAFYRHVEHYARGARTVVDFGCGRGYAAEDSCEFRRSLVLLRRKGRHVIGLDVDPVGSENPNIDEFRPVTLRGDWPIDAGSVDVAVLDWVAEHLERPVEVFREAARVLRGGGVICIRTPNLLGYHAAISRMVPNAMHRMILKIAQGGGREERDVFPTCYRANTPRRLRHLLQEASFRPKIICHEPEPSYLSFSSVSYALGVFYQRYAPEWARNTILAFGEKL
jgi:SAM-dependent methyltransferase